MQIPNDRTQNHLNMFGACITVAELPAFSLVWTGHEPADFATDFDAFKSDWADANSYLTNLKGAAGGAGSAKDQAETAAEDAGYLLARALCSHYRKTGDPDNLAKVNLTKYAIQRLRDLDLVATLTVIRDLGGAAQRQPGVSGRGVTTARVTAAATTLARYEAQLNAPRSQVVNRGSYLRELETHVAGMLEKIHALDDLVLQFDGTAEAAVSSPPGKAPASSWMPATAPARMKNPPRPRRHQPKARAHLPVVRWGKRENGEWGIEK